MNYLAHIYLSCNNEELMIGNFIADFITAKQARMLSPEFQQGIDLHRKIDSFTDSHAQFRSGTKRLSSHHGKYSPVVLDILYDHLLANNWAKYSGQELSLFASESYEILKKYGEVFTDNDMQYLPKMIEHDFLSAYSDKEKVAYVLKKMDNRTRFESNFKDAIDHLYNDYQLYEDEFNKFFPDIISMVDSVCKV